jgi:hypothetical protein
MLKILFLLTVFFGAYQEVASALRIDHCKRCVVLCEQSQNTIVIVDIVAGEIVWEWSASASNVAQDHIKWFDFPDEAKPVYNNQYLLVTASGGGVALIRIRDKKTVFYVYAGGNPHSAEVLPDGNIVSSSSTGNFMKLFEVDTVNFPVDVSFKSYPIIDGHNVVWDKDRNVLWAGSGEQLYTFTYNANCTDPILTLSDSILMPGNLHDLFPVYGQDALWLSTDTMVYKLDLKTKRFEPANASPSDHIKSVSSGPEGFPIILIYPTEKWWSDSVIASHGETIFKHPDLKIYKARWLLENHFSYPVNHDNTTCWAK